MPYQKSTTSPMSIPCHSNLPQDKEWQVKQNCNLPAFDKDHIVLSKLCRLFLFIFYVFLLSNAIISGPFVI